jgi:hypothetical protein
MSTLTTLLRIALMTYITLQTLNALPYAKVELSRTWEQVTVLYVLLTVGYFDPVVGVLLSTMVLTNLKEPVLEKLIIKRMSPDHFAKVPAPTPKRAPLVTEESSAKEITDPSFQITEAMLRRTQTNRVGNQNSFPNETNTPGVNIQGVFEDITGYAQ